MRSLRSLAARIQIRPGSAWPDPLGVVASWRLRAFLSAKALAAADALKSSAAVRFGAPNCNYCRILQVGAPRPAGQKGMHKGCINAAITPALTPKICRYMQVHAGTCKLALDGRSGQSRRGKRCNPPAFLSAVVSFGAASAAASAVAEAVATEPAAQGGAKLR